MLRFYAHLIVKVIFSFTAALLLIRSQPRDDHELRQFLLPDGCPAPCFMGVRPGVTTMDEASKLLLASKWVTMQPTNLNLGGEVAEVYFNWTGNQSNLLWKEEPLILLVENKPPQKVIQITFWLRLETSIGDLFLGLGKPSGFQAVMSPPLSAPTPYLNILYQFSNGITFHWAAICPITLSHLFNQHYAPKFEYAATLQPVVPIANSKGLLQYSGCS